MKLSRLLSATKVQAISGNYDPQIASISYDSRRASPRMLFFALQGEKSDGASFAQEAIENGAVAVVTSKQLKLQVPVIRVENPRLSLAEVASMFYSNPSSALKVAGVTGTNGKTTTTFLIRHICSSARLPCGLIGTVVYDTGGGTLEARRTTPEAPDIQEMLARMRNYGLRACALEASSHASTLHRLHAVEFETFVFTNLTQDHLDFHGNMEAYFNAKVEFFKRLPTQTKRAKAIINCNDRYGRLLIERLQQHVPIIRYGLGVGADFRALSVRSGTIGTTYQLEARGRSYFVRLPLIGMFNVHNSLAALSAASSLGIEPRAAVAALASVPQIPGRLERVPAKRSFQVFVDYAHTADALKNALLTLRMLHPSRRLIVVFGCGGDRDGSKRPLMARVANDIADWTIVTSDNPREEDPEAIISEIRGGFFNKHYECITDREIAIFRAVSLAQAGDVVLVAGKGHEKAQEFSGRTTPFDDVEVAARAIAEKPVGL
ncbi:UDP-N-acetylmuramoyl-L-alanyl-D-glutamate--2,6-diaminopimelate ligase [Candidatus Xiphinematobacter sp. Idaho Grape]|uniref:UDP-N-acetylmuramoyl-L-alanyl-D-glutamate--2, 6-diaminopimelate ligase n=1 Tax=Candidatus Xiphinematobacter sp. Idaho Grape TaxID=1704307 RepID=UPI00070590D2|nr:UDP-N-acetylmuramoyl-L-alanyl-D-glutamate--2,6-diaminopimelate ligase [Candidatus Xiphinematobacter sp. Idaho Grape]ALJ56529.1 UDP-N-acetylmuramoyl-L-alanyl-D-glutamate--2,6-diaminopimelate ligase [Candidatus Xiphinematobacter sp. Idaho Grape]